MQATELRAMQGPLKERYRNEPEAALWTQSATGTLDPNEIVCTVASHIGPVHAGLHPATGGDGSWACSGDMLLEALVGCAGVTLRAVSTAMGIVISSGTVRADGDLDYRGTLGVSKEAPVGFTDIRLTFELDTDATEEQLETLLRLTERYCVVFQTLSTSPALSLSMRRVEAAASG
jgi:uncharacterized OsmC-like protein